MLLTTEFLNGIILFKCIFELIILMKREKLFGAVVFTRLNGNIKYVIVQFLGEFYIFPKCCAEPKETEQ